MGGVEREGCERGAADVAAAFNDPGASSAKIGMFAALICVLSWTTSPLFVKHFSTIVDPWTSNGWRYIPAAVVCLPFTVWSIRRGQMPLSVWRLAAIPALANSVAASCFTSALYCDIAPAFSILCMRLQVVFAALAALFFFVEERAIVKSRGFLIGMALVILGTIVTVVFGGGREEETRLIGVAMLIACASLFGVYGALARRFLRGVPPLVVFAAVVQWTALFMLLGMLFLGERQGLTPLDSGVCWLLILSGLIGVAVGHGLYFVSISHLGVAITHGVIELQPFAVAVVSYWFFGEVLTGWQWAGGVAAVVGVLLMLSARRRLRLVR